MTAHRRTRVPACGQMLLDILFHLVALGQQIEWQLYAEALPAALFAQIAWLICFGH